MRSGAVRQESRADSRCRKTVRLRDKISFFFGVMNVLVSALLIGFYPTWVSPARARPSVPRAAG